MYSQGYAQCPEKRARDIFTQKAFTAGNQNHIQTQDRIMIKKERRRDACTCVAPYEDDAWASPFPPFCSETAAAAPFVEDAVDCSPFVVVFPSPTHSTMSPIPLVLPSLNTNLAPLWRYSGRRRNLNRTDARSPERSLSLFIRTTFAG